MGTTGVVPCIIMYDSKKKLETTLISNTGKKDK